MDWFTNVRWSYIMKRVKYQQKKSGPIKELEQFIAICFAMLEGKPYLTIAERAGLSLSTVYKLRKGQVSMASHYGTVHRLAHAAGLHLEWVKGRAMVSLAKTG